MKTLIEDLEQQVEYWRQRAEAAEAALRGQRWDDAVPPLTLYQTRMMRLLARRAFSPEALTIAMALEYPDTSQRAVYIQIWHVRQKLPAHMAPALARKHRWPYDVADRPALKAFLETGEIARPEQRRAA